MEAYPGIFSSLARCLEPLGAMLPSWRAHIKFISFGAVRFMFMVFSHHNYLEHEV